MEIGVTRRAFVNLGWACVLLLAFFRSVGAVDVPVDAPHHGPKTKTKPVLYVYARCKSARLLELVQLEADGSQFHEV